MRKFKKAVPQIRVLGGGFCFLYYCKNFVENLTYTFDGNGNITQIVDDSDTDTAKTVNYVYDDLNRLTSATASNAANADNFSRTYTYNAIGNITNKSDQDDYDYDGDQGTSYANPHAVTSIDTVDFTYDNNGNVLTITGGPSNTWDYNNRLSQSSIGGTTVDYRYDHTGQRISYDDGTTETLYPSRYYNTDGSNITKHIFAGNIMVATVEGSGASVDVYTQHADHLTGANGVTDSSGDAEQVLDYYPFGDVRVNDQSGSFDEQRKFAGHELDEDTGLTYMNARYYHSGIGRFMSQDPLQWRVEELMNKFGHNPQAMNFYSYTANNPIAYVDPDGQEMIISDAYGTDFVVAVYQVINELHPGTGLLKVDGGYQVVINGTDRIDESNSDSSRLVDAVVKEANTVTIVKTDGANETTKPEPDINQAVGTGDNAEITLNLGSIPDLPVRNADGTVSKVSTPREIALGHELIHAQHILEGSLISGFTNYKDEAGKTGVRKEELRAVGLGYNRRNDITENQIRAERGISERAEYEVKP